MKNGFKIWAKAAGIRAAKTVAQTAISVIGVSAVLSDVNWVAGCFRKRAFGYSFVAYKYCGIARNIR